jgi:hypothetical protein
MPYTPEQLLVMGAYEWERSVAFETFEQTRNQGLPELELFPDQATQMAQEEFWEGTARRFLEAKNILTVPAWMKHYRNLPLPPYLEPLSFMGVADDLTSDTRLEEGWRELHQTAVTDPIIFPVDCQRPATLIVHEGVPAITFKCASPQPTKQYPLALLRFRCERRHRFYAEELMLQFGFFDDKPRLRRPCVQPCARAPCAWSGREAGDRRIHNRPSR